MAVRCRAGLKFVSANNAGYYEDANSGPSTGGSKNCPPSETGSVELVTMPIEAGPAGDPAPRHGPEGPDGGEGAAGAGRRHRGDAVPGDQHVNNPVEVGGETTYEVHVANQGSKAAANVRLAVLLPAELKPLAAEGPTRYGLDGSRVVSTGWPSWPQRPR